MLLAKLPEAALRWGFAAFMIVMAIAQFTLTPNRGAEVSLGPSNIAFLFFLGIATGVLSGIFGIGGGFIVVTGYTFLLGGSDITARGTSLLMMIPTTFSGTVRNMKNKLTDMRTGLLIGLIAAAMTPFGKMTMTHLSPRTDAILVGVFLCALTIRSIYMAAKYRKKT